MIGCGDVTEVKSGPAFDRVPHSRRIAVMSRTEEKVRDYAERHGIPRYYTDASRLIADPAVNAVYIATPPESHARYSVLAMEAGKPVYVEKPMARTYRECVDMVEASRRTGVPLYVAYYRRRLPKFMKVKDLIENGALGRVRSVRISLLWPPGPGDQQKPSPWRVVPEIAGGGYFVDLAAHQFDFLDWILGPVEEASGVAVNQAGWYAAEDAVAAHFRFRNGVIGSGVWNFTVSEPSSNDEISIVGDRGTLLFSCFDPEPVTLTRGPEKETFELPWPEHVQEPLVRTVVEALRGEGECPSTGESGTRTTRVLESILHP